MMKRIILIMLAVCLVCFLGSCNIKNPDSFVQSNSATTEGISDKNIEITKNEERITVGIFSLEEYNNFVKTTELPDNFIYWEKLSQLGEFESIVFTSDAYSKKDYSCYLYNFVDETGTEISLYVYSDASKHHFETYKNKYHLVTEINSPDMRNIDITDKTSVYYNQNLLYTYVGGELSSITWVYKDIEYVLCMISGKGNLCDYPDIDSTLAGQLLHSDQANEALNEFINSMDT